MSNPFPFNHSASIFTPWAGPYKGVTLGVSVSSNGVGACEFVPSSNGKNPGYSLVGIYNILCSGSQSTAMQFIVNGADAKLSGPFYFILGSSAGNIVLYSVKPDMNTGNFSASNVQSIGHIDQINSAVAGFGYSPISKCLYVVGQNGNIYQYTVSFDANQKPSFTYVDSNKNYYAVSNGQVSITLIQVDDSNLHYVVTGVSKGSDEGIVYGRSLTDTRFLPGSPKGTVAAAFSEKTLYAATTTQLYMIDQSTKAWKAVWTAPSNITLTSLGYCPMRSAAAKTAGYTAGLLTMGGFAPSQSDENINAASVGAVYGYNPATGVGAAIATGISGQVYSAMCDLNGYAFCCNGSTGFTILSLAPTAVQPTAMDTAIVNYVSSEASHPFLKFLLAVGGFAIGVMTGDGKCAYKAASAGVDAAAGAAETIVELGVTDGAALDALLLV